MIRDFLISINEKYQRNKTRILTVVAAVILGILVLRNINKDLNTTRGRGYIPTTSGSVSTEEQISKIVNETNDNYNEIQGKIEEVPMTKQDFIKFFIQLCNNGKVDSAYECLSDDCKEILYPTKQSFIDNYYSVIFKISKEYEITEVKNDTYRVKFISDSIATGGQTNDGDRITDYITYVDGGKVSISSYISKDNLAITSIAPYFTVYIDNKQIYMDHIVFNIRLKNNTKADIYIDDIDNSNLYIRDMNNNIYAVDSSEMIDSDYLISAGKEKNLKLAFNINYENNNISEICLGNMKIVNKDYLDSTVKVRNPTTGEMEYAKAKTNYPEHYSWNIKF